MSIRSLFAYALLVLTGHAAPAKQPNIVFIFSDDHALKAISAYGGPLKDIAPTPNIDRLATQGAVFENSFCANSICGPSRACIMTGLHSPANGFLDNDFSTFDGNQRTMPKLLQKAGYETAIIGKWHLVSTPQGFDHWEILPNQGHYYNPDFTTSTGTRREHGYVTDLVTDKAISWLDKRGDKSRPFLLMCQHKAPHRNWAPAPRHLAAFAGKSIPEPDSLFDDYANRSAVLRQQEMSIARNLYWGHDMKFRGDNPYPEHFASGIPEGEYPRMDDAQKKAWDAAYEPENAAFIAGMKAGTFDAMAVTRWKYQRYMRDYLACVRAVDESVGRLLDYLDKSGQADNTIVIYSSDQGFYLGEHGWYDKRWMFEESMKMPFLIRWPGVVKPGTRPRAMIQNIDYAPTFLDVAGAPPAAGMHGRSMVPVLKASPEVPPGWRDTVYYFYSGENTHRVAAHDGVRTARHKLIHFTATDEWNLFDLDKDPGEMRSVHADPEYAGVLADMKNRYHAQRAAFGVNAATIPDQRLKEAWWKTRHAAKVKEMAAANPELVFLGDSITQGWDGAGKEIWKSYYGTRAAVNLGFSGDRTEHVLWRLFNGELGDAKPKVLVLMIGTNNTGHHRQDPRETAAGIERITGIIRDRSPGTKILLLGVFPRGNGPDDPLRAINAKVNAGMAALADGAMVHYLDIGARFLAPDGTLPGSIMPDKLHLSTEGYRIWAEAIEAKLAELGGWPVVPAAHPPTP